MAKFNALNYKRDLKSGKGTSPDPSEGGESGDGGDEG